jgi:hypothetical protein
MDTTPGPASLILGVYSREIPAPGPRDKVHKYFIEAFHYRKRGKQESDPNAHQ